MNRKSKRLLTWAIVVCMIITNMLFSSFAFAATKTTALSSQRLAGADRYQTALAISQADWTTSNYAVLAYGEGFADALTAAPLAAKYDAPILLTDKGALSAGVLDELKRLAVKNVFIVGGEGVVSAAVSDAVKAAGVAVERLAGADRYATALAVANKIGTTDSVVVAYGENYPDALGISAIAAAKGMPILLTDTNAMNADVKAFIGTKKAYVVGGEGVVSASVFNGLTGAVRLSGADRYATNLAVLQQFAGDLNWLNVFVATGEGFADALAGSALAARYGSPVVLAGSSLDAATASFLAGKVTSQTGVIAFGGAAVVGDAVVSSVAPAPVGTLGVSSISAVGLGAIQVVFNQVVDEDTAESVANYQIDGVGLDTAGYAGTKATLASDNKTLLVLLNQSQFRKQYATALFTVKKNVILSDDTLTTVPKFEQVVTFSDTQIPAVKAVSVTGNKKISVEFTEPVLVQGIEGSGAASQFKIDGQYLTNFGYKDCTIATTETADHWTNKINLNFSVALPAGSHTLTTPKGSLTNASSFTSSDYLVDGAFFKTVAQDNSFTVESVTGAPAIVSIDGQTNGDVAITFNRSMDQGSAVDNYLTNYWMNTSDKANRKAAAFKSNTNDTVVKLYFPSGFVKEGSNVLVLKKDTIKDAYGNKLNPDDDLRVAFTAVKDTTKPTVTSVVMLDNKTLRVKFSENVDQSFARNVANYKIVDSSGQTVTSDYITSSSQFSPATDNDSYSIALSKKLTGSNYTITIKYVQDLAATPNVMDDYTATINGSDDDNPSVDGNAVMVTGSTSKVAVFFDEAMDPATVQDIANYAYKGGDNSWHSIPTSTTVQLSENAKYVILQFPTGYTIKATSGYSGSVANDVIGIRVANVKDAAGNTLDGIADELTVLASGSGTQGPEYVKDSLKLYMNGDNVRAEFDLNQTLNKFFADDFTIGGYAATDGYLSGKTVVLNFTNNVAAIRALGKSAALALTGTIDSCNDAGIALKSSTFASPVDMTVYDEQIAPVWLDGKIAEVSGTTQVVLTFNENLDQSRLSDAGNDFLITAGGTALSVDYVVPNGGTSKQVVFVLKNNDAYKSSVGQPVTIKAKSLDAYHVYDVKDRFGDQNAWDASSDDKSTGLNGTLTLNGAVVLTKN